MILDRKREIGTKSLQTPLPFTPPPSFSVTQGGFGKLMEKEDLPWIFILQGEKQIVKFSKWGVRFSFKCPSHLHPRTSILNVKGGGYLVEFLSPGDTRVFSSMVIRRPLDEYLEDSIYRYLSGEDYSVGGIKGRLYRSRFEGKKEEVSIFLPYPKNSTITLALIIFAPDILSLKSLLDSFSFG